MRISEQVISPLATEWGDRRVLKIADRAVIVTGPLKENSSRPYSALLHVNQAGYELTHAND